MTTPSKWNRLNKAADLYTLQMEVTQALCKTIKGLRGGLRFEGEDTEENRQYRETALAVAKAVEHEFHAHLDPYVERLEEIAKAIKDNLPKPPGSIILPGEDIH